MQTKDLAKLVDRVGEWTYPSGTSFELARQGSRLILWLDGWQENRFLIERSDKSVDEGVIPGPGLLDPDVIAELELERRGDETLLVWRYWRFKAREEYEPTGRAFVVKIEPAPDVLGEVDWV